MVDIQSRKQLLIDERFIAAKRDVALVVNPPAKAGVINVPASTAPSIVEHDGVCYLYQGLNGATSLWTSADGLDWTGRGRLKGIDDVGGVLTGINSVFIDPKDADYPFKGLYEFMRPAGPRPGDTGAPTQAVQPGGLYLCRSRDGLDWEYLPGVAIPFLCDTQNQMLYDPWRRRYAAYVRHARATSTEIRVALVNGTGARDFDSPPGPVFLATHATIPPVNDPVILALFPVISNL